MNNIKKQSIPETPSATQHQLLLLVYACLPSKSPACHADNYVDDERQDAGQNHIHLYIPPEHHAGHVLRCLTERDGLEGGEEEEVEGKPEPRITMIALQRLQ